MPLQGQGYGGVARGNLKDMGRQAVRSQCGWEQLWLYLSGGDRVELSQGHGVLGGKVLPSIGLFFWSGQQQQVLPGYSLGLLGSQEERNHLALQSRGWGLEAESEVYKPSVGVGGCLGPRNPASLGLGLGEGG